MIVLLPGQRRLSVQLPDAYNRPIAVIRGFRQAAIWTAAVLRTLIVVAPPVLIAANYCCQSCAVLRRR